MRSKISFLRSQINTSILLISSLIFIGCGAHPDQTSKTLAYVDQDEKELAFELVEGIDYIPFAFTMDGCYGRALYMSMELAAAEIPSSALYIFGRLQPNPRLTWRFHVAPLLIDRESRSTHVLDPSLASQPVSFENWLDLVNPMPGYETHIQDGSTYFTSVDLRDPETIIDNFEELSSFRISDIASACQTMFLYLQRDPNGSLTARRQKLLDRTAELMKQLDSLGKIEYDRPVDVITLCQRRFF